MGAVRVRGGGRRGGKECGQRARRQGPWYPAQSRARPRPPPTVPTASPGTAVGRGRPGAGRRPRRAARGGAPTDGAVMAAAAAPRAPGDRPLMSGCDEPPGSLPAAATSTSPTAPPPAFAPGDRVRAGGHAGTVRYCGRLAGREGEWVGVQWDDAGRGRHDGCVDGRRYFDAPPSSATFVRAPALAAAGAARGVSLGDVLKQRYGDDGHGPAPAAAAPCVVVGADAVAARLARLAELEVACVANSHMAHEVGRRREGDKRVGWARGRTRAAARSSCASPRPPLSRFPAGPAGRVGRPGPLPDPPGRQR